MIIVNAQNVAIFVLIKKFYIKINKKGEGLCIE